MMGHNPFRIEKFFQVRAYGRFEVYPESRLRDKTPNNRADF